MDQQRLAYLLDRHAKNAITAEEQEEFLAYLHAHAGDEAALEAGEAFLVTNGNIKTDLSPYRDIAKDILQLDHVGEPPTRTRLSRASTGFRRMAAAAILLLLATGAYIWLQRSSTAPTLAGTAQIPEIAPGSDGAILTRADGSKLVLDTLQNGELTERNGARLLLDKGKLSYTDAAPVSGPHIIYNTITTPNARTYHLRLQDGTAIWLNAGSSVTYPVTFNGKERKVKITGEVYLEVAKAAGKPFIVNVDDRAEIEVLGTQFNINAYSDETVIRTTLLEGSVRISAGSRKEDGKMLKPGQQAVIGMHEQITVAAADTDEAIAWKNGLFHFSNAGVQQVMRQVARWYDVDIRFEGPVPVRTFSGEIERNLSLQQVLAILRVMRINYTIDNQNHITIRE